MLACEFTKQKLAVFFLSHSKYSKFNEPRLKGVFSLLRRKVIGESKMHNIFQKGFCSTRSKTPESCILFTQITMAVGQISIPKKGASICFPQKMVASLIKLFFRYAFLSAKAKLTK